MKKIITLISLAFCLQQSESAHAQIPLLFSDTTVDLGSSLVLGLHEAATQVGVNGKFSNPALIGFPFSFFSTPYTSCVIGANNLVSFDTSLAGDDMPFTYSEALTAGMLNKSILFPFQSLAPNFSGLVSYLVIGQAPNRKFIVEFCKTAMYNCTNLLVTDQLILNEGSNLIEMHITKRPGNCNFDLGTGIQGVKNGSTQIYVAGRSLPQTQWEALNEGRRFTPVGNFSYNINLIPHNPWHIMNPESLTQVKWYDENNVLLGTGASQPVTPGLNNHFYIAKYTGVAGCDSTNYVFVDTVHVKVNDTSATGLHDLPEVSRNVLTYPNPAQDFLTIACKADVKALQFMLTDISGRMVYNTEAADADRKYTLPLKGLPTGMYYLKVITNKGVVTRKIAVRRP